MKSTVAPRNCLKSRTCDASVACGPGPINLPTKESKAKPPTCSEVPLLTWKPKAFTTLSNFADMRKRVLPSCVKFPSTGIARLSLTLAPSPFSAHVLICSMVQRFAISCCKQPRIASSQYGSTAGTGHLHSFIATNAPFFITASRSTQPRSLLENFTGIWVNTVNIIAPMFHTSEMGCTFCRLLAENSGGPYSLLSGGKSFAVRRTRPKSITFAQWPTSISTLSGLISQWT
mmetsp:Transcript_30804/g.84605  ORF Transcript_30804/g.84605 Transcript_30804/m.84605 type:complete len:231 (+) Transcript_30804:638-1330(+)